MTNCKNCGAPLPPTGKCEYCGSFFPEHQHIVEMRPSYSSVIDCTSFDSVCRQYIPRGLPAAVLVVDGEEIPVEIECYKTEELFDSDFGRDITGNLYRVKTKTRVEITCVAYL